MVLTATGASSAVKKVLPDLQATISGNSIRVPTPDVSMAILSLQLQRPKIWRIFRTSKRTRLTVR